MYDPEGAGAERPRQPYGGYPPSAYGPPDPYATPRPYPPQPVPVPVEMLYSEARPARQWLRIPLSRPLFTLIILGILVLFYIPIAVSDRSAEAIYEWGAKDNGLILEGEWWRLFTATLLHGPLVHILLNGYALYIIGLDVEALFGRWRFLAIYWVSALGGSVASFAFSPPPGVGASGAVFGLVGALAVYFGLHRGLFGRVGQAQFWNIIVVIAINAALGFSNIFRIDNAAHIGGLVVGAALGYALCPRYAFGEQRAPNIRELVNINTDRLAWVATALIAVDVILAFFAALLLYQRGIWSL